MSLTIEDLERLKAKLQDDNLDYQAIESISIVDSPDVSIPMPMQCIRFLECFCLLE